MIEYFAKQKWVWIMSLIVCPLGLILHISKNDIFWSLMDIFVIIIAIIRLNYLSKS